jgi:hypothetical protein
VNVPEYNLSARAPLGFLPVVFYSYAQGNARLSFKILLGALGVLAVQYL